MNETEPAKPLLFWQGIHYDALLSEAQAAEPTGEMADRLHAARYALTQHPQFGTEPLASFDRRLHQEWMRHRY